MIGQVAKIADNLSGIEDVVKQFGGTTAGMTAVFPAEAGEWINKMIAAADAANQVEDSAETGMSCVTLAGMRVCWFTGDAVIR